MPYWTTGDRPEREQFGYWREVICEAFTPLAPRRTSAHRSAGPRRRGIDSWVRSRMLTTTNSAEVASETQLISHGDAEVRRTDTHQVFVNLQLEGHCVGTQDGRRCVVPAGGFALFDTTREYDLEFVAAPDSGQWRVVSFRVPRSRLLPLLGRPHTATSVTRDGTRTGTANLVAGTMMSIWRNADGLDPLAADAAESAFVAVRAADVGASALLADTGRETLDATLRAAIDRHLAANLRAGTLTPQEVSRRFGISVRKLHALYAGGERSFARTVTALRVEACADELATGRAAGSLSDAAARWGFCDLSHLNRVFRSQKGCLPSEYRARTAEH